jgi:methyl-accepting chemotaxis protein
VRGSNCDGLWGKEGLRLRIRVLPPWYKTWWARTIFFGTLGISILLGFRWYLSVLSRRNAFLEETIAAKTQELRSANEALKALVARIQALSFTLASSATQMSSHTENMASATKQIAKGTLSQRQNAERMAAAMIEFSASIEEVTGHVRSSIRMVEEAVRSAGEGEGAGKSTYNAMNRIKETTKRITSIVEVMQEIAHQTNLLSLNAAIEAVKAGDAGRGFTVVAGEVGKLADRSSVAARQITQLIGESAEVVRDGVVTVDTTVSALEQIRVVIRKLADMTTQIGYAAEQQAKTSEEVARQVETEASETVYNATAIQALTASVDELALSSAEIARAAEELSHIAQELRL